MLKKVLGLVGILTFAVVATVAVMKWLDRSGDPALQEKSDVTVPLNQSGAVAADWCAEHRVPESECTKCHPKLVEVFKSKNDWCAEHGLPESHCRQCNPSLTFSQEPAPTSSIQLDIDSEISVFFPKNKTACATDGAIIQFASVKTAQRAGLTIEPAISAETAPAVEAPAEVVFDESQTTVLTTTVPALVVRWLAKPGDMVARGEVLAELESPEMPNLKAALLEERAAWSVQEKEQKRMEQLKEKNLISASAYEVSQATVEETRAHLARAEGLLRSAGLSSEEIESVATEERSITAKFSLRAPQAGMFMERKAALGNLVPPGTAMAFLSAGGSVWLEAQVREEDLNRVKIGQKVEFVTDAAGFHRGQGNVAWVARFLDPTTRTGKVRVMLRSDGKLLHPGEFGRALIFTRAEQLGILVPMDAVQWEGCCNVVFVEESPDRFRPRKVQVEPADMGHYRVTSGLKSGELIVVKGSYLLKTELKKGSIGAGCCAVEPAS